MKKTQKTKSIYFNTPTFIWSLCAITAAMYAVGVGSITYNVVERKSVQAEVRKLTARIAESESVYADTVRTLSVRDFGPVARVQYITVDTSSALGMAR